SCAREAFQILALHGDALELVLTDVVMPDEDGRTMARKIQEAHPAVRVVYMSGYPEHRALEKAAFGPDDVLIAKPFSNEDLASTVRRALDLKSTRNSGAAPSP
ncbi:MAG TPA: response regulator, partial [Labilithrix sp.]